jgi:hypothetical protein
LLDISFGHYARVLIDLNLNETLCHRILVERTGYAFFVDIEYENLPDFCTYCKCTGHYFEICKRKPVEKSDTVQKNQGQKKPVYVEKKNNAPEVLNLEKAASQERVQQDLNLEKEVNNELEKSGECLGDSSKRNVETEHMVPTVADSESTNGSEFVDATQAIKNDSDEKEFAEAADDVSEDLQEDVHEIVRNDLEFLKESWANLQVQEPNDGDFELNIQQTG